MKIVIKLITPSPTKKMNSRSFTRKYPSAKLYYQQRYIKIKSPKIIEIIPPRKMNQGTAMYGWKYANKNIEKPKSKEIQIDLHIVS